MIFNINLFLIFIFYYIFSIYDGNLIIDESKRATLFFILLIFLVILNFLNLKNPIIISSLKFYYRNLSFFTYALIIGITSSMLNTLNPVDTSKIFLQYFIILFYGFSFFIMCYQYRISIEKFFSFLLNFSCSIMIPSLLIYVAQVFFGFDTTFSITAFHLQNIFGLPALEGILNPVNTVFFTNLILYLVVLKPNFKINPYNFLLILLSLTVIFLSVKRSGLFNLLELFLFIFYLYKYKYFIFFVIPILFFLMPINFNFLFLGGTLENSFFESRNHIFLSLADMFFVSPFFGFGIGYHNFGYQKYSELSSTDSTYLSFLIDTGIFGFLLFMMWVFRILFMTFRLSLKTCDYRFIGVSVLFYSNALFSDVMNNPSSGFILFMVFLSFTFVFSFLHVKK